MKKVSQKKPKEETIKFWQEEFDRAEKERMDMQSPPQHVKILIEKANKAKKEYYRSIQKTLNEKSDYMRLCRVKINEIRQQKAFVIPADIQKWFNKYISSMDWGYKSPEIIHISENKEYIIVRNTGGTAGTGTVMGTGGYYYAKTSHWIAKVGGNEYGSWGNSPENLACEYHGRLGKIPKELMLQFIDECINGERDFYTSQSRHALAEVYPEAFTEEEKEQSKDWR